MRATLLYGAAFPQGMEYRNLVIGGLAALALGASSTVTELTADTYTGFTQKPCAFVEVYSHNSLRGAPKKQFEEFKKFCASQTIACGFFDVDMPGNGDIVTKLKLYETPQVIFHKDGVEKGRLPAPKPDEIAAELARICPTP